MKTLIRAAGLTGRLHGMCALMVEGTRIVAVLNARDAESASADKYVDLPEVTLAPGLIDAHVHLSMNAAPSHADVWKGLEDEARLGTLSNRVTSSAEAALRAGITTVRDLGDVAAITLQVRAHRTVTMPKLLLAGPPITSPGGHLDQIGLVARGPEQVRDAAQSLVRQGVDVVKVMASGGNMTTHSDGLRPQFSVDELRAIVEVAHEAGIPVTAHALCVEAIRVAVEAGIDSIEHATMRGADGLDDWDHRLVERMARQGVWVTVTLGGYLRELPPAHPDLGRFWAPFARLRAAGVRVVAASDAGVRLTPIDAPAGMLSLLIDGFRLPGQDALDLLTREPADALGLQDRGRLEPCSTADVIGLDGDPTMDATALRRVRLAVRAGELVWLQREVPDLQKR